MRTALLVAMTATIVLTATSAEAAGGRRRTRPPVYLSQQGAYGRYLYPQYYGGIHARQLQNIGIPTGDIGIRGNGGVTMFPW